MSGVRKNDENKSNFYYEATMEHRSHKEEVYIERRRKEQEEM